MKIAFNILILSALLIVLSLSAVAGDSYMKHFKEIEVNFENTESNNSNTPWRNREVNFGYRNKSISEIVEKIMTISGKEIVGLEQLANRNPTVMMMRAKAIKAVTTLLKCEGFRMIEKQAHFIIVEDKKIDRASCLF
jgi:hypothetical protein